jgi:hypothetical protein
MGTNHSKVYEGKVLWCLVPWATSNVSNLILGMKEEERDAENPGTEGKSEGEGNFPSRRNSVHRS